MAYKGGCNSQHQAKSQPAQAPGRMNPNQFARNDLSKGGVNKDPQHKGGKGKA